MNAYKKYLTIDNSQQLILTNLPFKPGEKVEIIILSEDDQDNLVTDETPTEKVIEGIYQGLQEAITGDQVKSKKFFAIEDLHPIFLLKNS